MLKKVTIKIVILEQQAEALAQFFKRMGNDDYHLKANHFHATELEDMKAGANRLREALASAGFDPR